MQRRESGSETICGFMQQKVYVHTAEDKHTQVVPGETNRHSFIRFISGSHASSVSTHSRNMNSACIHCTPVLNCQLFPFRIPLPHICPIHLPLHTACETLSDQFPHLVVLTQSPAIPISHHKTRVEVSPNASETINKR